MHLARVRLANQLLVALTPEKVASWGRDGGREKEKKRERNKYEPCLAPRRLEREKRKRKAEGAERRVGSLVHPSAGLQFSQLELFVLATGY